MTIDFALALNAKDSTSFTFASDLALAAEKQVIYVGSFFQKKDDVWFDVTESDLDNWILQYSVFKKNGIKVPLPEEHDFMPGSNRGEVIELSKRTDEKGRLSLYAKVEFLDAESKQKFNNSQVSLYSPPSFTDGLKRTYRRPITHIALTDYPVVPDLGGWQTIAASNVIKPKEDLPMPLRTLAKALEIEFSDATKDDDLVTAIAEKFSLQTKAIAASATQIEDLETKLKAVPTKEPVVVPIAAGILNMARDNRKMKLSTLVKDGRISPAVSEELAKRFVEDDKVLSMCLSSTDVSRVDDFDVVFAALSKNEIVPMEGATGPQVLQFSTARKEDTQSSNVLTRLAEEKAKA